ncbi:MAG: hypothetical protein O2798_08850 [Chloroflexi bacterium]|nr:hypothetical protein [Chloroflexota bacterium]MDA1240933.1 hypothetical protein [Chloroflexota bacterium]
MRTRSRSLALGAFAAAVLLVACSADEPSAPAASAPSTDATSAAADAAATTTTETTPPASGAATTTEATPSGAAADPYDTDYGSVATATPASDLSAPTSPPPAPTPVPADSTPTPAATPPATGVPAAVRATEIRSFRFEPLTVAVGTTVSWTNADTPTPHTVTFEGGTPDSGNLGTAPFSHTFATAGVFSYFCRIHPTMTGTVTVQ